MPNVATIRTTCPRDCYDACGILVKAAADGTINVVGDPDHSVSRGALCGKCSNGVNVNALNPGAKADLAESCAVHSINMSIAPA